MNTDYLQPDEVKETEAWADPEEDWRAPVRSPVTISELRELGVRAVQFGSDLLGSFTLKELEQGVIFRLSKGDTLAVRTAHLSGATVTQVLWNGALAPYSELNCLSMDDVAKRLLSMQRRMGITYLLIAAFALLLTRQPVVFVLIGLASLSLLATWWATRSTNWPSALVRSAAVTTLVPLAMYVAAMVSYHGARGGGPWGLLLLGGVALWRMFSARAYRDLYEPKRRPGNRDLPNWKHARIVDAPDEWVKCAKCGWILPAETYSEGSACANCRGTRREPVDADAGHEKALPAGATSFSTLDTNPDDGWLPR